jgi:hypothetical protein
MFRWNAPQLSRMQSLKLKRAMELQGLSWPLTKEVKELPNGKKQVVRRIVDEPSAAAAASSAPSQSAAASIKQHVESSFFHDVKFKGHKCQRPFIVVPINRSSPPVHSPPPSRSSPITPNDLRRRRFSLIRAFFFVCRAPQPRRAPRGHLLRAAQHAQDGGRVQVSRCDVWSVAVSGRV